MAFRARVKHVMLLLLLVTCIGHSYAGLKNVPKLSNNELKNQNKTETNTEDAKTQTDTLGLESVLGRDWESENKPLSDDEISSIYKNLFGSNGTNVFSIHSDSKPNNPEDIQTVLDSQFDEQGSNNDNNKKDVIQNSKTPMEDSQQATFSSSDTPLLQGTNNLGSILSDLQPKNETGIYSTTTPSNGPENIDPYTIWPSIIDDDIPTSPSIKINTPKYQNERNQTLDAQTDFNSDFLPDTQSGVLPTVSIIKSDIYTTTTPSNWYVSQGNTLKPDLVDDDNATNPNLKSDTHDEEIPTTPRFVPENQTEMKSNGPDLISINSTHGSFSPNNQSVPSDQNPNIPKHKPIVLIRPGFGYRRPHFWPFGYNFGHRGHIHTKHRCRNNQWFGRHGHNFHRVYPSPPNFNLFNSQTNYRQLGHPTFKLQHQKHFNHCHGCRYHNRHPHHWESHGNYRNPIT